MGALLWMGGEATHVRAAAFALQEHRVHPKGVRKGSGFMRLVPSRSRADVHQICIKRLMHAIERSNDKRSEANAMGIHAAARRLVLPGLAAAPRRRVALVDRCRSGSLRCRRDKSSHRHAWSQARPYAAHAGWVHLLVPA